MSAGDGAAKANAMFHGASKKKTKGTDKVEKTMNEFKEGNLHSGSKKGPKVTSRAQAIAIGLSQQRKKEGK